MKQNSLSISFIMPIYNEANTAREMIEEIVDTMRGNRHFEIIVVESNSTDGTREVVSELAQKGEIYAVFQDAALGKGNAVREGLGHAKNEIIIIFDGDREYQAKDVFKLIEPIEEHKIRFVLGSRYEPGKPMRSFGRSRIRSMILNQVHKLFSTMCNLLYSVSLRDPFTMYKVFLREDVKKLNLVENGFAFDVELVAKLIRMGSKPIEVPVKYKSRGFGEGKKIRFFRDGYSLPIALIRHRWSKLFHMDL